MGEATTQAFSEPIAASLINEIVKACEEVGKQKKSAKLLGKRCQQLATTLTEEADGPEDEDMRKRIDEVTAIFYTVRGRTQTWAKLPLLFRWWRRDEIGTGIEDLMTQIEIQLEKFSMQNQIAIKRAQNNAEDREMLIELLTDHEEILKLAERHSAGETIANDLIEQGEKELQELRKILRSSTSLSDSGSAFQSSRRNSSSIQTIREKYLALQKGLVDLRIHTGILPADKRLDGQIERQGDMPIAGGPHADIWKGSWLGQTPVALKALQHIKSNDEKAQKRLIREIEIWSKLKSKHVLQFYGVVTDIRPDLHIVTPWLENGNVLEYLARHPDVDRMQLVMGAAEGVRYLHSVEVIHGNIKCRNILVTDSGQACISDFGMAETLQDITKTPMSSTLSLRDIDGVRWTAPEIVEGESPSEASDVYSFAMSILEMLTEKPPLYELKRDIAIIRAMAKGGPIRPKRPMEPEVVRWLTNELWGLLELCWTKNAHARPTMEDIMRDLSEVSNPLIMAK